MVTLFPGPAAALPQFNTLVIQGPYHASAPVHLMLSHSKQYPEGRAICFASSRSSFMAAMSQFNDEWLAIHGGDGMTCAASSRVTMMRVCSALDLKHM
ncbi:hypothetical protein WOLCODRAFT_70869 [Wolfiporia cocos MD-104 SS10]|uniref:Uncharacterized protein n=1 Tax=Wolfiporia cocos (strain MD-104) TaxID=742152 RepID=A0A2H3JI68_WOLCO|nr:hypothetical protein WOLCODRAFT_70869 [Wolfiporia cocos MD-104 SS10]